MNAILSYQLGIGLAGVFLTAFVTWMMDGFVDGIQTRILSTASKEDRAPIGAEIAIVARTQIAKNSAVLAMAGGVCVAAEIHRWNSIVSPLVLIALFGRYLYLLADSAMCLRSRARLPRGLPKSVMPGYACR